MTARLRAWAPAVLWAAAIYLASSQPTIPVDLSSGRDKIAHFLAYAVLGALLGHAVGGRARIAFAVALGLLYALFDEIHQSYVPGRAADAADWVADALGTITGALGYDSWYRRRRSRRPSTAEPGLFLI